MGHPSKDLSVIIISNFKCLERTPFRTSPDKCHLRRITNTNTQKITLRHCMKKTTTTQPVTVAGKDNALHCISEIRKQQTVIKIITQYFPDSQMTQGTIHVNRWHCHTCQTGRKKKRSQFTQNKILIIDIINLIITRLSSLFEFYVYDT